jgi:hypothetical protein
LQTGKDLRGAPTGRMVGRFVFALCEHSECGASPKVLI